MSSSRAQELHLEKEMVNKLYKEISGMKFSFKMIRKVFELDALLSDLYR